MLVGAPTLGFGVDDPAARSGRLQALGLRPVSLAAPLVASGRALVQFRVPAVWTSPGRWTPGYAAVVDGSGFMMACCCSHSMGDR